MTMTRPSVVFLCTRNAGRSQMAAGFARQIADDRVDVSSGGLAPADAVNETVVTAMAEAGIDLSNEAPKRWVEAEIRSADVIVTMGCSDTCPVYPGKRYEDWAVPDPAGLEIGDVRAIRDEIRERVRELLSELPRSPSPDGDGEEPRER